MGHISRYNKTEEIIKLAILMHNSYRGVSIADIANYFECSYRTAERMKALIIDIFQDKVEEVPTNERLKRWRFKKGSINYLANFSKNDVLFLQNLKNNFNNPLDIEKIDDIVNRIKILTAETKPKLNENSIATIMEAEGYLIREEKYKNTNSKYLEIIRKAILSSNKIQFNYGNELDCIKRIKVNPYGIKISDKYFLVAYNEEIKGIRQFAFDKITNIKILDELFERNKNFDLENASSQIKTPKTKIKKIILEFDKKEKDYVLDSLFSPKQKFEVLKNGNIVVTYYSEVSEEICLELIKWGSNLKIISPIELKEEYKNFLNRVIKNL